MEQSTNSQPSSISPGTAIELIEDDSLSLYSLSESDVSDVEVRPSQQIPRGRAKSGRIWKHSVSPR